MSTRGYLRGLPGLLRRVADRLDPDNAPRGGSLSFTFEHGAGIRMRQDGRGCPLWHLGDDDYSRAFDEADQPTPRIDWKTATVTYPTTRAGRQDT